MTDDCSVDIVMYAKRIAIVGGGSAGIASAKSCLEENLEPVIFEQTDSFGGLWRYRETTDPEVPSLMKATIINTCKEMGSFSDFPVPKDYPNYMHHTKLLQYFELYVNHFGLMKHFRFNTKVTQVRQAKDYEETGRWEVTTENLVSGELCTETYDGVLVCNGHHTKPYMQDFPGLNNFRGKVLHTHDYKIPEIYRDKNVLIIGVGNSGADAAVDLSTMASKVYLSARRGCWVIRRVGFFGIPADTYIARRIVKTWVDTVPYSWSNFWFELYCNEAFGHKLYRLKPEHRFENQHPTINDALPNGILSGRIIVKGNVHTFTENGVIMEDDLDEELKLDVVILATGYKVTFPFLDADVHGEKGDNQMVLYKHVFPPHLKHPSLAFIGLVQLLGSVFPGQEAQSRWYAQLMAEKLKLPSNEDMISDTEKMIKGMQKRYVNSPRHTFQCDWVEYMDDVTSQFGAKPDLWKMFWKDTELWLKCYFGPCLPYQYRLQGPHPWSGARAAIMSYEERLEGPLDTRKVPKSLERRLRRRQKRRAFYARCTTYILLFVVLFYLIRTALNRLF